MIRRGVVAAIDFGTCNTRLAFGIKQESYQSLSDIELVVMNDWKRAPQSGGAQMTPTSILFDSSGETVSYGWAAEGDFCDLTPPKKRSHYLFKNFKMELHKMNTFSDHHMLEAINGGRMSAIDVFSKALKYLSSVLVEFATTKAKFAVTKNDICWVLTVPAIWKPGARHFMRNAAYKAGLWDESSRDALVIALEPECAALCVRANADRYANLAAPQAFTTLQYAVVDCGGGTVDIAYHKVEKTVGEKFVVKELVPPSGGPYGGTLVDQEFEEFLNKVFGPPIDYPGTCFIACLKKDFTSTWIDLMKQFEIQKTVIDDKHDRKLYFTIGMQLVRAVIKITGKDVLDVLQECPIDGVGLSHNDAMQISTECIRKMYRDPVDKLCECLETSLQKDKLQKVDTLYMVGTFSMSHYLLGAVRSKLRNYVDGNHIFNPPESQLTIVRGAIMYGINPAIVQERIASQSYGVNVLHEFNGAIHPWSKRVVYDGIAHCKDIYWEFLSTGQVIKSTDSPTIRTHVPAEANQRSMAIEVYCAPHTVQYTTDPGCKYLARIIVDMPDTTGGRNREVQVTIEYNGPEIHFRCTDKNTGKSYDGMVEFQYES